MKLATTSSRMNEKRTWVEKVTDDTNSWLLAANLQREGHFEDAASHYIKDASEQKDKNILRAALSISSAANCLANIDKIQESARLFLRASKLYETASESVNGDYKLKNWLSERISYCYMRASNSDKGTAEVKDNK